jgi:Rieske Fe-S protein
VSTLDAMPRPFHPAGGPTLYAYVENGTPVALSDQCTHRGCAVAWQDADNKFVCPCHGGTYDRTGTVLGGPPPRPLPRLQTKVEAGTLYVQP